MEQSLQYSVAWFSSQPSHTTLLGSAWLLAKDEAGEAATSTVDAKWLMGREEATAVAPVRFAFHLLQYQSLFQRQLDTSDT